MLADTLVAQDQQFIAAVPDISVQEAKDCLQPTTLCRVAGPTDNEDADAFVGIPVQARGDLSRVSRRQSACQLRST